MVTANGLNISQPGVVSFDGTSVFTGSTLTQHDALVGGANNTITSVSPSTAGFVYTSNGVSADPTFQASSGISSAIKVTTYNLSDSPATWTKSTTPPTKRVEVYGWAGGAGGGSGRKGASTASGGGSGGGGGIAFYYFGPASFFGTNESVVVGAGGLGGAAQTTDLTDGNTGQAFSGNTSFGNIVSIAGAVGLGGTVTTAAGRNGGNVNSLISMPSSNAPSGAGSNVAPSNPSPTVSLMTSTGGGGGSGYDLVTVRQAGNGGSITSASASVTLAGGLGGIETGTINGTNGNVPLSSGGLVTGGTGGGGGGGPNSSTIAGNGGNGAIPGGGGGGGGGGISTVANSGAGGNGGDGRVIVIEYF